MSPRDWRFVYRHSLTVRIAHWLVAIAVTILLMSGLQIFNAHPALYWGNKSQFSSPVAAVKAGTRNGSAAGLTDILGHQFQTTGVLGVSGNSDAPDERAFPSWATLPAEQDLAAGRSWHFVAAWLLLIAGLIYLLSSLVSGHFWRDLIPSLKDIRSIGRSILDHLRFRTAHAPRYNVLQKLTYCVLILIVFPAVILSGLTLSPGLDAAFPFLTAVFDGRQSARTVHFLAATAILCFLVVHLVMVLLTGPFSLLRSMITGWYSVQARTLQHER
jgi:thiosulfate reductase cytochrome b subunit